MVTYFGLTTFIVLEIILFLQMSLKLCCKGLAKSFRQILDILMTIIPALLRTRDKISPLIPFLFEGLNKFSVESDLQELPY